MNKSKPVSMIDKRSTVVNDNQTWEFTCKTCGGHQLTVTRIWSILAGPASESWQEWGPLEANHLWRFDYKEKIKNEEDIDEEDKDAEVERGDFGEFAEDDSASKPEEYETIEQKSDPEGDEFYVNCENCDREIEFGWSQPERGGRIFPVECSDFIPGEIWPEPRYAESWQQKHWLRTGNDRS
jgi:hypothetical protein